MIGSIPGPRLSNERLLAGPKGQRRRMANPWWRHGCDIVIVVEN
jgi:hypothetical protein